MVSLAGPAGPDRQRPVASRPLVVLLGGPVSELPVVGRWSLGRGLPIPDEPPNERPPLTGSQSLRGDPPKEQRDHKSDATARGFIGYTGTRATQSIGGLARRVRGCGLFY